MGCGAVNTAIQPKEAIHQLQQGDHHINKNNNENQDKVDIKDLDRILKDGFHEMKSDLIQKRVSVGRRSVTIAQNLGTVDKQLISRQPVSWQQKVITSKGEDTRKKVQQNNKYPFCSIGYISMDFMDAQKKRIQGFGTGCLIHKRIVLTCAHNVYDRQRKLQAYEVYFVPAMSGLKGRRYKAIKFYYPRQYRQAMNRQQHEWDFALMQLDAQDLSQQYGFLGVNTMLNGQQIAMLYGYPGDLNPPHLPEKFLFGCQGLVRQSKRSFQQLNYDMPTFAGQSGSPIIRKVGANNYQVIGVHIRYIQAAKIGQRDNSQQNCNSGVKFTEFIKNMINNWVKISTKQLTIIKKTFDKKVFKQLLSKKWDNWQNLTKINFSQNNIDSSMLYYFTSDGKRYPNLSTLDLSDNQIDCSGIPHLTKNYFAFPNLEELILDKNKISTNGIKSLIAGHQCFPVLNSLYLAQNKINGNSITELTKNQGAFPLLDNLDIGQNQLQRDQCDDLAKIAKVFPNLTQFGIARNGLGDQGIEKLFSNKQSFQNTSQLGLANNLISGEGMKYMMKGGKNHFPNLTRLWLQNNLLGNDGCKWLCRSNVFPNLVQLQIYSNEIGPQGVLQLTKIKGSFPKLEDLRIELNLISNTGVKYLADNYQAMPRLIRLYLDSNKLSSQGIHYLIQNRQVFPKLKVLSLVDNEINSDGIKHLMYECQAFYLLEELYLQKNKIGDIGVQYFAQSLNKVFKNIKVLGLRQNNLTTQSIKSIAKHQQSFSTLRTLGLNMNLIDSQAVQILIKAKLKLPTLQNMWLVGNKIRPVDLDKLNEVYPSIKLK